MFHKFVFALLLCMVFATGLSAGARPLFGTPLADDPLQARIYRLDNGLTVAFSVNRETPNIRGCIAFRVGSGDDPADKTGLAHYLEHLLFKGSEKLGTTDYRAERPLLEQIEKLYDRREASRDPDERQELYREIDRLSAQAGQYTVQNEFVQAINEMGGSGLNAYTSLDRTVYFNSLPANQLEKFIRLQFDRFRSPVFRGFHTELETVFEEFNLYQDRPGARQPADSFHAVPGPPLRPSGDRPAERPEESVAPPGDGVLPPLLCSRQYDHRAGRRFRSGFRPAADRGNLRHAAGRGSPGIRAAAA